MKWLCVVFGRRCSAVEEKLNMPEGMLKKVVKTKEEKQRELQEVVTLIPVLYSLCIIDYHHSLVNGRDNVFTVLLSVRL